MARTVGRRSFLGAFGAVILGTGLMAGCGAADQPSYLTEDEELDLTIGLEEVETPAWLVDRLEKNIPVSEAKPGEEMVMINEIINLGKKIWAVIEKNKPVVEISYDYANALPKGVESAASLSGFSDLQHKSWRLYGKNLYGMTVYDVTYTVVHQYGGSYDGKGKYLTTVSVVPSNVEVMWGYKVNYNVSNVTTTNVGTDADPVASMTLEMKFQVSTVVKSSTTNQVFQFRGDSGKVRHTP